MEKVNNSNRIFISYRRSDSYATDQIAQELQYHFGNDAIIQDILNFTPGENFPSEIESYISSSSLIIVVIGQSWSGANDKTLLNNPYDWVRIEIELGLAKNIPIIPILLAGSKIPTIEELPESLHPLVYKNALQLRSGEDTTRDLAKIVSASSVFIKKSSAQTFYYLTLMPILLFAGLSGAIFSSKLIFNTYQPQQWPNFLLGLTLAAIISAYFFWQSIQRRISSKWIPPRPIIKRKSTLYILTSLFALIVFGLHHSDENNISHLYKSLEAARAELPRVSELLKTYQTMPRYFGSTDIGLISSIVEIRLSPSLNEDQFNAGVNALTPFTQSKDNDQRNWANLIVGDIYRFVKKYDLQLVYFNKVVNDKYSTKWQKWYSFQEIGNILYVQKRDFINAKKNWEEALTYRKTRGVLQNLAILDEDSGDWASAEKRYSDANAVIATYKNVQGLNNLADQEAAHFANWCNMQRRRAQQQSSTEEKSKIIEYSLTLCQKSIQAYKSYLDGYWNMARTLMLAKKYPEAAEALTSALEVIHALEKSNPEALNRFGYNVYGEKYTIWLLVVNEFLSNKRPNISASLKSLMEDKITKSHKSSYEAIRSLIKEMEDNDLTMNEDYDLIERIYQSKYFK